MNALINRWNSVMTPARQALATDIGLLLLRLGVGLMMAFSHGLGKMQKLFAGGEIRFGDPIGIGQVPSLVLAASAELVASLFLVVGLMTRMATVPLIITMLVAVFIVHADDPFKKQEFGLLYLVPYLTLLLTGPGRLSIDHWLTRRNR